MPDCIFCKMVAGEIQVQPVYETDDVLAFDDISPQSRVHTLIVPKRHVEGLSDPALTPDIAASLLMAVNEVARLKGIDGSGYRTIVNTGPDSRQEVMHLHLHVLGGQKMAAGMVALADE